MNVRISCNESSFLTSNSHLQRSRALRHRRPPRLRVRIEPRERGGIEIELQSRVEPYYGESIRRQADTVLEELGIRHARVHIEDEGALPFVISARLEAAVRRAGWARARASCRSSAFPKPQRGPPAPLASLCTRQRTQVLHQRCAART